jgi:dGTPase
MFHTSLASYASNASQSKGRLHIEPESRTRSAFQRDRDRIVHCSAFRRLKHKTQVFVAHVGDSYRTRLTHSLEVAQIARSVARELKLDEDLAETLALAHDLGHTPFGHAGEDALHEAMSPYGGFDHNAQTLRIVTRLEQRYLAFDGLNLTWESLEGVVKHNGPLLKSGTDMSALPYAIRVHAEQQDLQLDGWPSAEAQIAALADDIAYNNHDIDDGLRAGLFTLEELTALPVIGDILTDLLQHHADADPKRIRHEAIRRMISRMIFDLVSETQKRLEKFRPESVDDIRGLDRAIASFSSEMEQQNLEIKQFLRQRMYKHFTVNRSMSKAKRLVRDLFGLLLAEPSLMPDDWAVRCADFSEAERARYVCDYVAGMTDRFAIAEYRRLFDIVDELA